MFSVLIIPHTLDVTTLGGWRAGSEVNLEVDLMARYAARLVGNEVTPLGIAPLRLERIGPWPLRLTTHASRRGRSAPDEVTDMKWQTRGAHR